MQLDARMHVGKMLVIQARHVDIQFTVSVGMKVGRYFGDDLYIGEVRSIDNDHHTFLYEDGDEEIMDTEQVQYAYNLYLDECT